MRLTGGREAPRCGDRDCHPVLVDARSLRNGGHHLILRDLRREGVLGLHQELDLLDHHILDVTVGNLCQLSLERLLIELGDVLNLDLHVDYRNNFLDNLRSGQREWEFHVNRCRAELFHLALLAHLHDVHGSPEPREGIVVWRELPIDLSLDAYAVPHRRSRDVHALEPREAILHHILQSIADLSLDLLSEVLAICEARNGQGSLALVDVFLLVQDTPQIEHLLQAFPGHHVNRRVQCALAIGLDEAGLRIQQGCASLLHGAFELVVIVIVRAGRLGSESQLHGVLSFFKGKDELRCQGVLILALRQLKIHAARHIARCVLQRDLRLHGGAVV
mmetsp:Transcript_109413/g.304978  ORF Transcript_109413/g.304978 Transcript_109413/m.304978 type:complete len:333 (-) Transcript_109413:3525-4523(-)